MTYVSKTTFCLNNLKILRPKVTKNIKNLRKNFCEQETDFRKNDNNNVGQ